MRGLDVGLFHILRLGIGRRGLSAKIISMESVQTIGTRGVMKRLREAAEFSREHYTD